MMHNSMSKLEDAGSPINRVVSAAVSEQNNQNISFTTKVSHYNYYIDNSFGTNQVAATIKV
jgi:hypothetical protein